MQNSFGIALGSIFAAEFLQFRAQCRMIENLAVVDEPHRLRCVRHGLLASGQIDDAQTAVTKMRVLVFVVTETVRTAVRDIVGHPTEDRLRTVLRRDCDVAGDSAHRSVPMGQASEQSEAQASG
jgi:hypothetical protein